MVEVGGSGFPRERRQAVVLHLQPDAARPQVGAGVGDVGHVDAGGGAPALEGREIELGVVGDDRGAVDEAAELLGDVGERRGVDDVGGRDAVDGDVVLVELLQPGRRAAGPGVGLGDLAVAHGGDAELDDRTLVGVGGLDVEGEEVGIVAVWRRR